MAAFHQDMHVFRSHLLTLTIICLVFPGASTAGAEPSRLPGEPVAFTRGAQLFSNRKYPVLKVPEVLADLSFLRTDIDSSAVLECTKSFTLYALTPVKHPTNSLAGTLLNQGFERLETEPFQLFGSAKADLAGIYRKTLQPGEIVETRKWVVLLARDLFFLKPASLNWQENDGEVLYNNIRLPRLWPPRYLDPNSYEPMPVPYLEHPPETINITVGRQLFVDDFLIEKTTLKRSWHSAKKDARNPVFTATTEVERKNGVCYLGNGGVFYDPAQQLLKMWYSAGELDGALAYATSHDGINWQRPDLGLPAGGNLVLPRGGRTPGEHAGGDNCLWLDTLTSDPGKRLKFLTQRSSRDPHWLAASADGRDWSAPVPAGKAGDYCSFFHNPFRKVWSYSIKRGTKHGRSRYYAEAPEFLTPGAFDRSVFWCGADRLDEPDSKVGDPAQLYSLNAVAYESLIVGAFSIHLGPNNGVCAKGKFPKITEIKLGFSRDGFHWSRPERRPFIAASRKEGAWDRAYLHSPGGVFFLDGDEMVFPYCGYSGVAPDGRKGMYFGGSIGLARLRRDGFASMDAGESGGTLTTRPLNFEGSHLYVNVDCPDGELRAELVDTSGQVIEPYTIENCEPVGIDSTLAKMGWKGVSEITGLPELPVRIRFQLQKGSLYSFWFSDSPTGSSSGYLAAGKLGHSSIRDE